MYTNTLPRTRHILNLSRTFSLSERDIRRIQLPQPFRYPKTETMYSALMQATTASQSTLPTKTPVFYHSRTVSL